MGKKVWLYNSKCDCAIETETFGWVPVGWEPLTAKDREIIEEERRRRIREEREMWLDILD